MLPAWLHVDVGMKIEKVKRASGGTGTQLFAFVATILVMTCLSHHASAHVSAAQLKSSLI